MTKCGAGIYLILVYPKPGLVDLVLRNYLWINPTDLKSLGILAELKKDNIIPKMFEGNSVEKMYDPDCIGHCVKMIEMTARFHPDHIMGFVKSDFEIRESDINMLLETANSPDKKIREVGLSTLFKKENILSGRSDFIQAINEGRWW